MPVEGSAEAEEHYLNLSNTVNDIPKHHIIIECGDFNAHIGRNEAKFTYHTETNNNGKMLLAHSEECGLRITNTLFKKKLGKLWTYISDMNGRKSQIDYILVNKKWRNSVHNNEAYNGFSSVGSHHRVLVATIRLSYRAPKKLSKKKQYNWNALHNTHIQ